MAYVLRAKPDHMRSFSDGYYTGYKYIYQGAPYAVVDRDISKAKRYTSKKRAEKACEMAFENYLFEVDEVE